jgi:hypothetical protein
MPVGDEVIEGSLEVHGLPDHDEGDHEAEGAQMVLLAGVVVLA